MSLYTNQGTNKYGRRESNPQDYSISSKPIAVTNFATTMFKKK